ncbi:BspA family leucine-rich repeat surface protein [uncultured Brachyspira sp.]|uniref:BspA family leucine-rich repeat surface protein n=1 Tax=uncultured Brachyspira sp. TaxID=221953 RepID=UPI002637A056|nr:BspA family leucine-rich repeat surface protein [uncultured Brachyspira sp.]
MHKKFKPNNTKELKQLVDNESVNLNDIDTSLITNMSDLFKCSSRKNYDGIENWDTSNVENMHGLFSFNSYFNNDISKWNVSKVKIMSKMFHFALCFNQPLNEWNVGNAESMNMMFHSAKEFNQSLDKWNVSKVRDMRGMFADTLKFNQDINNWNVGNVKEMDNMFNGALSFNHNLNKWNVSKVESMNKMFAGTHAFNQDLNSWDMKNLHSMTSMFENSFMYKNNKISLKFKIYSFCLENNNNLEYVLSELLKDYDINDIYYSINTSRNKKIMLFRKKLENDYYDELKGISNDFKAIEEAENYIENNYNEKDENKVKFIDNLNIGDIFTKDKTKIVSIKVIKYIYLSYLALKRDFFKIILTDNIINLLDRKSFIEAVRKIYISSKKETSAIIYGIYGGDEALKEIYSNEKYSKLLLIILSFHKESDYAMNLICNVFRCNEREDIQKMADDILHDAALMRNISEDELIFKTIPNFGFDKNGDKILEDNKYKLIIKDNEAELFDIEKNKILKSYTKNMHCDLKEKIKYLKKEISFTIKNQNFNLIKLLMSGKKYSYSFFKEIFIDNIIMNRFAVSLVWNMHSKNNIYTFRYCNDGSYSDENDESIEIDENSYISLASPSEMPKEIVSKWKNQLNDYELAQPIMQFSTINIDNIDEALNKLKTIEINYGLLKSFVHKYEMKRHFLNTNTINKYSFYDSISRQCFYVDTNISYYAQSNDSVVIKPNFAGHDNSEVSKRFIYTWLTFLIWELKYIF